MHTAMRLALRRSRLIERLQLVDCAPPFVPREVWFVLELRGGSLTSPDALGEVRVEGRVGVPAHDGAAPQRAAAGHAGARTGGLAAATRGLLDERFGRSGHVLMAKLDVEGHEWRTLLSASRLFEERRLQHLVMEVTPGAPGAHVDMLAPVRGQVERQA